MNKTILENAANLYGTVSNLWTESEKAYSLISSKDILKVGSILQSLFNGYVDNIKIPRIVTVGSQSSGKSSLLNGILSFDLLPTGKDMVTRTPLHIELIPKYNNENVVEFGKYINGMWEIIKQLSFSLPNPTDNEQKNILNTIEMMTNEIVGNNSNISELPINLKIYSKDIPNLTLIDLPGLTMVACTDRGQPKDIKDKIRTLIGKYIENENTIILAVMPARTDIEADIALELIKQYDPNGDRTIGVLTKIDLMNDNTDIIDYLKGNVSKDLKLNYGYYAVRNRTFNESKTMSVIDGFKVEKEYFKKHVSYSKLVDNSRLGIPNMTKSISNILVNKIKETLPHILTQINQKLEKINNEINDIGYILPNSNEAKYALIHSLINYFNKNYISNNINTGRNIKDIFIKYREELSSKNPFNNYDNNKLYISECIKNCEGNHMTFPTPLIEVLEKCLTDPNKEPIYLLLEISKKCCKDVSSELLNLIDELIKAKRLINYPNLIKKIKNELTTKIIIKNMQITNDKIYELFKIEENYIWTDNNTFREALNNVSKTNISNENVKQMNTLLKLYYDTIIDNMKHNVPKIIMFFLVKQIENDININFYDNIMSEPFDNLLEEDGDLSLKKKELINEKERLIIAKQSIINNNI
jgi:dynamin 1-like protein